MSPVVQDASPDSAAAAAGDEVVARGRAPSRAPRRGDGSRRGRRRSARARPGTSRWTPGTRGELGMVDDDQLVGGSREQLARRAAGAASTPSNSLLAIRPPINRDRQHGPVRDDVVGQLVDPARGSRPRVGRGASSGCASSTRSGGAGRRRPRPGRGGPPPRDPPAAGVPAGCPPVQLCDVAGALLEQVRCAARQRRGGGSGTSAGCSSRGTTNRFARSRASSIPCRSRRRRRGLTASHSGPVSRSRIAVSSRKRRTSAGCRLEHLLDEVVDDVPVVAGEPGDERRTGRRGRAATARPAGGPRPSPRCGRSSAAMSAAARPRPVDAVR